MVERVDLAPDRLAFSLNLSPISNERDMVVRHAVPTRIRRRGVEMKLVLEGNSDAATTPDPALIKAIARAHRWFDDLVSGRARSLGEISEKDGVSDRYVMRMIPLAFLAPRIVEAILTGIQPTHLTVEILTKRTDLPLSWPAQTALLQFD
ncbi:MAG: hypothetical protein RID07_06970 [Lacipirellulaceae bacterium]